MQLRKGEALLVTIRLPKRVAETLIYLGEVIVLECDYLPPVCLFETFLLRKTQRIHRGEEEDWDIPSPWSQFPDGVTSWLYNIQGKGLSAPCSFSIHPALTRWSETPIENEHLMGASLCELKPSSRPWFVRVTSYCLGVFLSRSALLHKSLAFYLRSLRGWLHYAHGACHLLASIWPWRSMGKEKKYSHNRAGLVINQARVAYSTPATWVSRPGQNLLATHIKHGWFFTSCTVYSL